MRKSLWVTALVFVTILAPVLRADNLSYSVDLNVGGDILTGTITTDGKIGQLLGNDVTAFSLSDSENILGTTLTQANATVNPTFGTLLTDLTASLQQLTTTTAGPSGIGFFSNATTTNFSIGATDNTVIVITSIHAASGGVSIPNIAGTVIGTAVPDLDPSLCNLSLALVVGAMLIIRGGRKIPAA